MFRNATFSVLVYTGLVSVSRILALWHNYHAPFAAISHLSSHELPRLLNVTGLLPPPLPHARTDEAPSVDLRPIADFGLRLCVGKEWHRFPGSFLVPFGVDMRFVKSEFDGLVPGRFHESGRSAGWLTRVAGTSTVPVGQNDLNREDLTHYVSNRWPKLFITHTDAYPG
jgi:alpha-1,2-mannosyltransferase